MAKEYSVTCSEVRKYLSEQGYENLPEDLIESFRKDLRRVLKADLRRQRGRSPEHSTPLTAASSTSTSCMDVMDPFMSPITFETRRPKRKVIRFVNGEPVVYHEPGSAVSDPGIDETDVQEENDGIPSYQRSYSEERIEEEEVDAGGSRQPEDGGRMRWADKAYIFPPRPAKTKKCDPVSRYQYYKREWEKLKIPGEAAHSRLRWEVRGRTIGERGS